MSNSTKAILIFLVVVLIVLGIWYLVAGKNQPAPAQNPATAQTAVTTTQTQSMPADSISQSGSSDASFSADLNSIDAQLKVVDTNSASVDQSLNDKPIAQTE
jgi:zona occludens toxin (predicted ATPase)